MTVEHVLWTALPNGMDDEGRLRLSVHVAPRLRNDDGSDTERQLGEFPTFERWAEHRNNLRFEVAFDGGPSGNGIPEADADTELWNFLFPPETRVGPHVFQDHAKRDLHAMPVRPLLQFLEQAYGAAAAKGTELPSLDDPLGLLAPFLPLGTIPTRVTDSSSFYQELARAREGERRDGRVIFENVAGTNLPPAAQEAVNAFFQAYRFYHRPGSQRPDLPDDLVEPSPKPHDFEFHEVLSGLADFPDLLRRLGVVIDLIVEVDVGAVPADGVVRVLPHGDDLPTEPPSCPGTHYELDRPWFGARPESRLRMTRGVLRLSPEFYDLFQVDVDGAALHAVDFGATIAAMTEPDHRTEGKVSEAGLPALRSAGLALARQGRAQVLLADLKDRRGRNGKLEAGQDKDTVFGAEDLVRGYRVDVFDQDAPGGAGWFSLHRRLVEHMFKPPDGGPLIEPLAATDEGYLKATSASSETKEHPTPSDDLYLHETICGWEGWSLAAPRPGKRITEPGQGEDGSSIAHHDPDKGNPFPLVSRVRVEPGTLPRLRIGHTYRVRARTVDLAGNSVPFTEGDLRPQEPDLTSEAQRYLRFEPVPSPAILRRHLDTEGESLENLAIRSNLGVSAADYPSLPEVVQALAESGAEHAYAEDSQRHLAPPKGSEQMAEQDGRLEGAFGGPPAAITEALRTALREEGTFLDEQIVDIATGQKTIAQTPIELFPASAALPAERGAGLPQGAYTYHPSAEVLLPYLPDPLAIGVSLTGYDFTGAEVFHQRVEFDGDWPELKPFRVRLSEGPLGAAFTDGVLEVRLPKAEVVWARLASVFPDGRLQDLAVWQWIAESERTSELEKAAHEGRHWMLTPFRRMTFTHAVQQPLLVPAMTGVVSARSLGDTFAVFRGPIFNHAKSTGRLDVFGEWTEDVDLVTDDSPRMRAFGTAVPYRAQAFGFELRRSEDQADVADHAARHEFGDTKHRWITYHSVATTRFREFFPEPLTSSATNIQRTEETEDAGGTVKTALVHDILSSARPAAPDVLYVLPTFRWEREDEGAERRHVRYGKAVRVWLRRPWFSSGDDEQLGVVLEPGVRLPHGWERVPDFELAATELARRAPRIEAGSLSRAAPELAAASGSSPFAQLSQRVSVAALVGLSAPAPPSAEEAHRMLRPYVTSWGSDPVWKSELPELPPTVAAFPRHTGWASGLTLAELPHELAVLVAAHDVHFDRERKLWYCDIEIDPGVAYYPFVRLALARYQAHSVRDAYLSRVAMTDFIQLAPDRTAEVSLSVGQALVEVSGFSGRNKLADLPGRAALEIAEGRIEDDAPLASTTVRATLERRMPGVPGDLGWEQIGPETTLAPVSSGLRSLAERRQPFHVTWTAAVPLPRGALGGGDHRLLVTEIETHLRDYPIPGDPSYSTSQRDFVRERVVYADAFGL
jgi:hypothetical protein